MRKSGLLEAMKILRKVPDIAFIEFQKRDIVRHALVQKIIAAYEEHRAKPEEGPARPRSR
jgi:phosphate starvation-inducible PhoH-like protein